MLFKKIVSISKKVLTSLHVYFFLILNNTMVVKIQIVPIQSLHKKETCSQHTARSTAAKGSVQASILAV